MKRRTLIATLLSVPLAATGSTLAALQQIGGGSSSQSDTPNPLEVPLLTAEDLDVTLDRLSAFDQQLLPTRLQELEGRSVQVRGYMHPGSIFTAKEIKQFILTPETAGEPVAALASKMPLKCLVLVEVQGVGANFSQQPIRVQGMLRFRATRTDNGELIGLYVLEEAEVAPAKARMGYRNSIEWGC